MTPPRIYVAGYPGEIGGANTECWHTIKLWRRFGREVTCIPTWPGLPESQSLVAWEQRLRTIGVETCCCPPEELEAISGLRGATVVAFCNVGFLAAADKFRALGCRIVWVGAMNWMFAGERLHYRRSGVFHRYVFQSRFQRAELEPQLRKFGYRDSQGVRIPGAFDCEEFPFCPRRRSSADAFVLGRLSRAAPDKFHPDTWAIYRRVAGPVRARILGWNAEVEGLLGPHPPWAEVLAPGAETSRAFLASLDCLLAAGGTAIENWPRAGLEAMASGVPIVADNRGGWPEMIRHGTTGYLANTPAELADCASRLAGDEARRLEIARHARQAVEELSDPEVIWPAWKRLFDEQDP